jgi:DNA-directed RNA polymerase specialized sigma24 family protein
MDPTRADYDNFFGLLEPGAPSVEASFRLCRLKLVKFFAWRRVTDPSNLADETIVRLLRRVAKGQVISSPKPYNYVYGIADKVFREHCRDRKKDELVSTATAGYRIPHFFSSESPNECQQSCLKQLTANSRELLERYYLDHENREAIAGEHKMSINALRLKIYRIKQAFLRCCEECRKAGD